MQPQGTLLFVRERLDGSSGRGVRSDLGRWAAVLVLGVMMLGGLPLEALAPSAQAQAFGRNKIQYDAFDWQILRTEHFDVYYYPEAKDLAEHGAHFAEEAYEDLENRFAFSLEGRVPLFFYATNLDFKQTNITPGFIPDGVGGFFEFLKGRVVIPADGNLHRFRRVIRHEMVHVFTFNKMARVLRDHREPVERVLPLWFTEGLAEYWSGTRDFQHEMIMRDAVASNYFVPLGDLDRIAGTFVMYKEGEAFCHFISETYGEEMLLAFIENSWRDPLDFGEVMEFVLGEDKEVIEARWTAWVRARYLPDLDDADVPSLVSRAIAARGVSAKPTIHTFPDGRKEVLYVANTGSYTTLYAVPVDSTLRPTDRPERIIEGGRSEQYEAFHVLESRMDVAEETGLLVFVTKRGARDVIHLHDLRQRERVGVLGFEDLLALYSPTVSPDGERVVFTGVDRGGIADLYLYDRTTEQLRQLTHDPFDDRDPDFSPNGARLAFSSNRSAYGQSGHYNLFTYDLATDRIEPVTAGPTMDQGPRWAPDGESILFTSARIEDDGRFSAQDFWLAELSPSAVRDSLSPVAKKPRARRGLQKHALRSDADVGLGEVEGASSFGTAPQLRRLTRFTSAAYDPVWADSTRIAYTALENLRFSIRNLSVDSLIAHPIETVQVRSLMSETPWAYDRIPALADSNVVPYTRRYQLDVASGGISTVPSYGYSAGGAAVSFSDMLGNEYINVSVFSSNGLGRNFVEGLNATVTRVHLGNRANYGYGFFREAGPRYDRRDPDQPLGLPSYEQNHGALGLVSYPLSQFRRVDLQTSLSYGLKEALLRPFPEAPREQDTLRTFQLANAVSLVHDNVLYGLNGPVEGWRANLTLGYTTDLAYSNVNYYSVSLDARHYWRVTDDVTFASWGLVRANVGRRARYNLIGGSWSLRGYRFLRVRGKKLWFTSQEVRFPILKAPSVTFPPFAFIGLANVRGAAFVDIAHLWNEDYGADTVDAGTNVPLGATIGSVGAGLRANLFGALVLRYDVGWRFEDGLSWKSRTPFGQFFFGWDF